MNNIWRFILRIWRKIFAIDIENFNLFLCKQMISYIHVPIKLMSPWALTPILTPIPPPLSSLLSSIYENLFIFGFICHVEVYQIIAPQPQFWYHWKALNE
jgi:hypothetical protein